MKKPNAKEIKPTFANCRTFIARAVRGGADGHGSSGSSRRESAKETEMSGISALPSQKPCILAFFGFKVPFLPLRM
jgi:hypothetical protein